MVQKISSAPFGALLIETCCRANDQPMSGPNWGHSQMHEHLVSHLVTKINMSIFAHAIVHGSKERTLCSTAVTSHSVAVCENVFVANASYHLMPEIAGNPLRAIVPEDNLPVAIHQTDTSP
jgi:hypothetical protein